MVDLIKKNLVLDECELKVGKDDKKGTFEGYASVFDGLDSYRDTIIKGAFKETIKEIKRLPMFINHYSHEIPVGGYPKLEEDSKGLYVKGEIDFNHRDGPSLHSALEKGNMDALSIGFTFRGKDGFSYDEDENIRYIKSVNLKEISPVNFPADDAARISDVKFDISEINSLGDAEKLLRDLGLSRKQAVAIVSCIKGFGQRDADERLVNEITELKGKLDYAEQLRALTNTIKNFEI